MSFSYVYLVFLWQDLADLVTYLFSTDFGESSDDNNDGNQRAQLRASNGHKEPYNIKEMARLFDKDMALE